MGADDPTDPHNGACTRVPSVTVGTTVGAGASQGVRSATAMTADTAHYLVARVGHLRQPLRRGRGGGDRGVQTSRTVTP